MWAWSNLFSFHWHVEKSGYIFQFFVPTALINFTLRDTHMCVCVCVYVCVCQLLTEKLQNLSGRL
jgi:hypothetical protein